MQNPPLALIAENVKNQFSEVRKRRINEYILRPRGLNFDAFYQGGMVTRLNDGLALALDQQMLNYSLQTQILLGGIDESGAHIYAVGDPGTMACFDRVGYHAIGSGHRHAVLSLVARAQHKSDDLKRTVFNVFAAKRAAELAQGVGQATDIVVITGKGVRSLTNAEITALEKIRSDDVKPNERTSKAIEKLNYD